jgi:hypothetical protein
VSGLLVNIEHVGSFLLCREDLIFLFFFFPAAGLLRQKVPPRFLGKHLLLPPFSSHLSFSSDSSSSSSSFELLSLSALRYLISNSRRLTFPSYSSPPPLSLPFSIEKDQDRKRKSANQRVVINVIDYLPDAGCCWLAADAAAVGINV